MKLGVSVVFTASISATPFRRDASIIARTSRALEAIGFSHSTCLPRSMQQTACTACMQFGVAI